MVILDYYYYIMFFYLGLIFGPRNSLIPFNEDCKSLHKKGLCSVEAVVRGVYAIVGTYRQKFGTEKDREHE